MYFDGQQNTILLGNFGIRKHEKMRNCGTAADELARVRGGHYEAPKVD